MQIKITIPQPCNANWQEMSPRHNGRHCSLCDKTVVDFSDLTSEEITAYLQQHRGEKTCGRFRQQQLQKPVSIQAPSAFQGNSSYFQKAAAILAICTALHLQSCTMGAVAPPPDAPVSPPADTTAPPADIFGEVVPVYPDDSTALPGQQ